MSNNFRSDQRPKTRKRKLRGAAAIKANNERPTRLREVRLDNQIARVGMCAVCGVVPVKVEGEPDPPPMSFREYLCWKVLACDRHGELMCVFTIDHRLRFMEKPPEVTNG